MPKTNSQNLPLEPCDLGTPPRHFDLAWPWWVKLLIGLGLFILAAYFDAPIAAWVQQHQIPEKIDKGDLGRELRFLEQYGQWACSVIVITAVVLIDKRGLRRGFFIALACLATVLINYLVKDIAGRPRPLTDLAPNMLAGAHAWQWGGWAQNGSEWASFPSAHTTGAFALACALSWYYPNARGLFISLACITGVQRVLHNAHYPSDVVGGAILAIIITRSVLHQPWLKLKHR